MPGTIGAGATGSVATGGGVSGSQPAVDSTSGMTGTAAGTYDQTTATGANSWGNWGWIGIFGLLGLFGLRGGRTTPVLTRTSTDYETPEVEVRQ